MIGGVFAAPGRNAAFVAFGGTGHADVTPVEDQPVVSHRQQVRRDVLFERQLGLKGRFGVGRQADAVRDAEDVRIDRHHLLLPQHRAQHVGRLAAHARQALHLLQIPAFRR